MINQQHKTREATPSIFSDLMMLFKGRIVLLLLLAALGGAFLGARGWPDRTDLLIILVTGGLAAMGASALNEYLERGSDALMNRTRRRPLVNGRMSRRGWVPYFGTAMIALPVLAVLYVPAIHNPALAVFLALGAFIYLVIYTIWLKPRTPLNIVIGGAAGSCAVLSGGAAVGAWRDPGVVVLALLLFFWTPLHFWALALVYREDYARVGLPMLPVTTTPRRAAFWSLVHGAGAGLAALVLAFRPELGPLYVVPVAVSTVIMLWQGMGLIFDPLSRRAWRLFHTSNLFLAVVLMAIVVSSTLPLRWP